MIRPYRAKSSIPESHIELAKGNVVSQTEPSAQVPNAECPALAPRVFEDRAQPVDIALPTSPYTEISRPEVDPNPLPVCNLLAATAPPECQQQDPKLEEPYVTTTSPLAITEVAKEAIAVQLSKITGISLSISHLCLSQSDYDQAIALEAINFAADFATPNGLALQASILCLDNSLWNMEHAALVAGSVVKEVSEKTGMTMDWAIDFLYANGWTVKEALEAFEAVKVYNFFFVFFLSFSFFSFTSTCWPFFFFFWRSTSDDSRIWLRETPLFFFRIFCRVRLSKNRPVFFFQTFWISFNRRGQLSSFFLWSYGAFGQRWGSGRGGEGGKGGFFLFLF